VKCADSIVFFSFLFFSFPFLSFFSDTSTGTKYQSKVVRRPFEDALLERVGPRTYYIQLEGFIFFASATQVLQKIKDLVDASNESVRHFFFFFFLLLFLLFRPFYFFDLSSFSLLFPDIL